jgi:hypothetical protein
MDWTPIELKQRHRSHLKNHQHKPAKGWLPTLIFGTVGTMSIGIGIMEMGAGQLTELQCRRSPTQLSTQPPTQPSTQLSTQPDSRSISCTRTITTGFKREIPIEINNITGAKLQRVGRKFRNAYRVVLVTRDKTIPVTEDFKSDQRDKELAITQINRFIKTPNNSELNLTENDRAQSNLFGLMFIATGLLGILMAWVVQFSMHRKVDLTQVTKSDWSR